MKRTLTFNKAILRRYLIILSFLIVQTPPSLLYCGVLFVLQNIFSAKNESLRICFDKEC